MPCFTIHNKITGKIRCTGFCQNEMINLQNVNKDEQMILVHSDARIHKIVSGKPVYKT